MKIKAAVKFLSKEIEQEGTRSDTGAVLVQARTDLQSEGFVATPEWLIEFENDLCDATANSNGYCDEDWACSVRETLREYLDITEEEIEEYLDLHYES